MTWIKFTVSTTVQQMIVSCKTAKEAWDRLEKFLSPLCVIHVKSLRNKLRTAKKAPGTSMTDYLVTMRTIADALATAGAPIPEEDLVGYTPDGLDYNFIRIQSTLQMTNDIGFDELIMLLIREEDLINRHQLPEAPAALYSSKESGEVHKNRGRKNSEKKSKGRSSENKNKNSNRSSGNPSENRRMEEKSQNNRGINPPILPTPAGLTFSGLCQICAKHGHFSL